jgi:hypothetical protein
MKTEKDTSPIQKKRISGIPEPTGDKQPKKKKEAPAKKVIYIEIDDGISNTRIFIL